MEINRSQSPWKGLLALSLALCMVTLTALSLGVSAKSSTDVISVGDGRWALVKDGHVETSYTGISKNKHGWWRVKNGYVDFHANGVYRNEYGWWYVKNGKVDFDYTGIAKNANGWWQIAGGKVNFEANGVFRNEHGWWYVKQGKVDFNYTGLASNAAGTWYIKNGKADFSKNGTYSKGGVNYTLKGGKVQGNGKTIFLTFDDGPAQYTDQLLSILDKYGIKVTFFVTNCYPKYQYDIQKEFQAGHAVALHTYTHNYGTVYKSTSAYWNDFEKMENVISKQTGHRVTMFRFPGGSSNTVSRKYCSGVMTSLTRQAGQKGLTYYDWTVDSNDAGGTKTSDGIYNNISRGVANHKQSIVLCHDVKSYTVNAMDRTIKWALQNGYTFRTLQPGGYTVHQKVAN
ncbi:MAG: polysaccharide deacetylase [Clostridia bacterium]|nr:polysaccharide deacetylase [Clostridia bacterium]